MNKNCEQCGKKIERYIRKHEKNGGKYCSRECYYESKSAKKISLVCDYCGKVFLRDKWRITTKPMNRYFCGHKCYGLHKSSYPDLYNTNHNVGYRKSVELNCDVLRKEYYENKSRIVDIAKKYGIGYTTVNARMKKCCIETDRGRYSTGISYDAMRNKIKKIRGDKCEICGWEKGTCDTHHRISTIDGGDNSESNLIIVCPNCHRLIHEGQLKVQSELMGNHKKQAVKVCDNKKHVHDRASVAVERQEIDMKNKQVAYRKQYILITGHYLGYDLSQQHGSNKIKLYAGTPLELLCLNSNWKQ